MKKTTALLSLSALTTAFYSCTGDTRHTEIPDKFTGSIALDCKANRTTEKGRGSTNVTTDERRPFSINLTLKNGTLTKWDIPETAKDPDWLDIFRAPESIAVKTAKICDTKTPKSYSQGYELCNYTDTKGAHQFQSGNLILSGNFRAILATQSNPTVTNIGIYYDNPITSDEISHCTATKVKPSPN